MPSAPLVQMPTRAPAPSSTGVPSATSRSDDVGHRHDLGIGAVDDDGVGGPRAAGGQLVAVRQRRQRHERHARLGVAPDDLDLDDVAGREAGRHRAGPEADRAGRRDGPPVVAERGDHRQRRLLERGAPGRRSLRRRLDGHRVGAATRRHRQGQQPDQQQAQRRGRHDQHAAAASTSARARAARARTDGATDARAAATGRDPRRRSVLRRSVAVGVGAAGRRDVGRRMAVGCAGLRCGPCSHPRPATIGWR